MGTWSVKPFGNDEALDFLSDLWEKGPDGLVHALHKAECDEPDSDTSECAIAAAEIIAAAANNPVKGTNSEAREWILSTGYVPQWAEIETALAVVQATLKHSELKDSWLEQKASYRSWENAMNKLKTRLSCIQALPTRKKTRPLLLYKMIRQAKLNKDEPLMSAVRKKLEHIDPNLKDAHTDHDPLLAMLIEAGLLEEALTIAKRGANPDHSFDVACRYGNAAIVRCLIEAGAEITKKHFIFKPLSTEHLTKSFDYSTGLLAAVQANKVEIIEELVKAGADLHQKNANNDTTLLHEAASSNALASLEYLLSKGLDLEALTQHAASAISSAAGARCAEAATYLLEKGARPGTAFYIQLNKETDIDTCYCTFDLCHFCSDKEALFEQSGTRKMRDFSCNTLADYDFNVQGFGEFEEPEFSFPNRWFTPQEGLEWVEKVRTLVVAHASDERREGINQGLETYQSIFEQCIEKECQWRLMVNF